MVSVNAYPTFEHSNAVQYVVSKTAPREQKLGPCPGIPCEGVLKTAKARNVDNALGGPCLPIGLYMQRRLNGVKFSTLKLRSVDMLSASRSWSSYTWCRTEITVDTCLYRNFRLCYSHSKVLMTVVCMQMLNILHAHALTPAHPTMQCIPLVIMPELSHAQRALGIHYM